jgi:hypothetical protein
LKIFGKF